MFLPNQSMNDVRLIASSSASPPYKVLTPINPSTSVNGITPTPSAIVYS